MKVIKKRNANGTFQYSCNGNIVKKASKKDYNFALVDLNRNMVFAFRGKNKGFDVDIKWVTNTYVNTNLQVVEIECLND